MIHKQITLLSLCLSVATLVSAVTPASAAAETAALNVPTSWIPVGNEMEEKVDPETGKTVRYLTNGKSIDSHFHYSNGSWGTINGTLYLFFDSNRQRPEKAGKTEPGERQIMAANVKTGDLYYLTTIPVDGGPVEQITVRPYFATYNDVAKTVFFFNKGLSKIYAYNCLTGEQKMILALQKGEKGRALDEFADKDSVRIVYSYTVNKEDGIYNYVSVADFDRSLNLVSNRTIIDLKPPASLNHAELCPTDKNLFFYKIHAIGGKGAGKKGAENSDLYIRNIAEGTDQHARTNDLKIGHMVWGKSGNFIYWSNTQAVGIINRFDWRKNTVEVTEGVHTYHNQTSFDENLWVYDGGSYKLFSKPFEKTTIKNGNGHIGIYNMKTKQDTKYANILLADPHPRHAHPQFSTDDSMISFVTAAAVESENTRVAVMKVNE